MLIEKRLTAATLLAQGLVGRSVVIYRPKLVRPSVMRRRITDAGLSEAGDLLLKLSGRNSSLGALGMLHGERADVYASRYDGHGLLFDGSIVVNTRPSGDLHILPPGKTGGSNRLAIREAIDELGAKPVDEWNLWRLAHEDMVARLGERSIVLDSPVGIEYGRGTASNTQPRFYHLYYEQLDVVRAGGTRWVIARSRLGVSPRDIVAVPLTQRHRFPDDLYSDEAIVRRFKEERGSYFRNSLLQTDEGGKLFGHLYAGNSRFRTMVLERFAKHVSDAVVNEEELTRCGSKYRKRPNVIYGIRYRHLAITFLSEVLEGVLADAARPAQEMPIAA